MVVSENYWPTPSARRDYKYILASLVFIPPVGSSTELQNTPDDKKKSGTDESNDDNTNEDQTSVKDGAEK